MAVAESVKRRGWFVMPGMTGERTLAEQMLGIEYALAECAGKTVLDLGCAEGLIGREFVRAGALSVHGIDSVKGHIAEARRQCDGLQMSFELGDLQKIAQRDVETPYDIVLALAVLHKMHNPETVLKFAADCTRDLLVIRLPAGSTGYIASKHGHFDAQRGFIRRSVDLAETLSATFHLERNLTGPRGERVHYWRRK